MDWSILLATVVLLFGCSYAWSLFRNWLVAGKTGLYRFIGPINPSNPFWMILGGIFLIPLSQHLPTSIWRRIRYSMHGWQYLDQFRENPAPPPATTFMYVTPGRNEVWTEDPEIIENVYTRRKDFLASQATIDLLTTLGPSVLTSDGYDWQRQRRIVSEALNERISKPVWVESCKQAQEMVDSFLGSADGETSENVSGVRQIAINVLASAGYGISHPWKREEEEKKTKTDSRMPYTDVLFALTSGFIVIAFIPINLLCWRIWPKAVQRIGQAARDFPTYTKELVENQRAASETASQNTHHSFLASIVRLSDDERRRESSGESKGAQYLSEQEIQGGLFQFTLAGFDTTANTLAYAITLLAIHPKWQDWIIEEIDEVLVNQGMAWQYEETYPKLKRCLALMYETLRLYTPIATISRRVDTEQIINTSSGTYTIPAGVLIYANTSKVHTDKKIWGSDADDFRPNRWFSSADDSDELYIPRNAFLPWSGGPRICPGMKMAKVEFTAVISTIFRQCRIEPSVRPGQSKTQAVSAIKELLQDSQPQLTLQFNKPQNVRLAWRKR